jgi:hypothetical protein
MNINLHIERLILDGLPITGSQGELVQAAAEAELARLLTDGGLAPTWRTGGAVPGIRVNPLQLTVESDPVQIGQHIAQTIAGGLQL